MKTVEDTVDLRYAHEKGYNYIAYNDNGDLFATAGSDGFVRVWKDQEDTSPKFQGFEGTISALEIKGHLVFVALESAVNAYTLPDLEFDSLVAHFSTTVYCIACDNDGQYIAAGGSDFLIKLHNRLDNNLAVLRGHKGPILSLAFDPQGEYLASSSCDGSVCVWLLSTQECVQTLTVLPKTNDRSETSSRCSLDWSKDGKWLAVPMGKKVCLYARNSFLCDQAFTDECIKEDMSIVSFSATGIHACSADLQGMLVMWLLEGGRFKPLTRWQHPKKVAISSLKWHPKHLWVSFIDVEGEMGQYQMPSMLSRTNELSPPEFQSGAKDLAKVKSVATEDYSSDAELEEDFETEFEDRPRKDNGIDKKLNKYKTDKVDRMNVKDRQAREQTASDTEECNTFLDTEAMDDFEMNEEDAAFDIGAIKASMEPLILPEIEEEEEEKKVAPIVVQETPKPPVQASFQPGSSPVSLERRFMMWNSVGVVRCYNTEEERAVEVEFHNTSVHHPLQLPNQAGHTLAALSERAFMLAAPSSQDTKNRIECINFGCWGSRNEWTLDLPEDEEVEGLCCSETFTACITSEHFLRLFTLTGVQTEVIVIPGPPVACAAHGKLVVVAHHKGQGVENGQCLGLMLVKVNLSGHSDVSKYSLPLSPKSFLTWIGFSDEGSITAVDTSGRVSILDARSAGKWVPVANTRTSLKGKSDTRFVVGLSENLQQIRYILCRGSRYPSLLPRPTVSVLEFSLPFAEMDSERGKLEEEIRRNKMQQDCLLQQAMYEEIVPLDRKLHAQFLKMFALSLRAGRESRAREIHSLMPVEQLQNAAIKYAIKSDFRSLARQLGIDMEAALARQHQKHSEVVQETGETLFQEPKKEEPSIQPKAVKRHISQDSHPLKMARLSSPTTSGTIRQPSPIVKPNPFKSSLATPKREELEIDTVLSSSMEVQKPQAESKPSRFTPVRQTEEKSGFSLYFAKHKASLQHEAPPGASEQEVLQLGMKMYRKLTKEEKLEYDKSLNISSTASPMLEKTPKTSQPSATLAKFAFTKTPK